MQRGWLNYFRLGNIGSKLKSLDGWIRNRLRYCIWTDWKKPERKRKNLIRLGVDQSKAYQFSRTRKGGCTGRARLAQSPILGTTITLERLRKRGYESMNGYYERVSPMFNEPLYTKRARPVRTYSGVRGVLRYPCGMTKPSTRFAAVAFVRPMKCQMSK